MLGTTKSRISYFVQGLQKEKGQEPLLYLYKECACVQQVVAGVGLDTLIEWIKDWLVEAQDFIHSLLLIFIMEKLLNLPS